MAAEDPIKQVEHYAHALKAPRIRDAAARLAAQARESGWSHEEYLAAVLSREVSARESSGARSASDRRGGSRHVNRWRNSTSIINPPSTGKRSRIWAPACS